MANNTYHLWVGAEARSTRAKQILDTLELASQRAGFPSNRRTPHPHIPVAEADMTDEDGHLASAAFTRAYHSPPAIQWQTTTIGLLLRTRQPDGTILEETI